MKTSSPLRYPGGKSSFAGLLSEIRHLNGLKISQSQSRLLEALEPL